MQALNSSFVTATENLTKRTAIAIGPREMDLFFNRLLKGCERLSELLPEARFFVPGTANPTWHGWLQSEKPTILVTAWSTPLIPVDLPDLQYICHVCGRVKKTVPRTLMESLVKGRNLYLGT